MQIAIQGLLIGTIATIGMDAWTVVVKYVLRLPTTDWALVGRWFGHMPRGVFIHHPVAAADPVKNELAIGWIAHYLTGLLYGLIYLYGVRVLFSDDPSLTSALVFGLLTLVFPWFVMQPGMGVGVLATKSPRPAVIRLVNVSMHAVFGVSLYIGWLLVDS